MSTSPSSSSQDAAAAAASSVAARAAIMQYSRSSTTSSSSNGGGGCRGSSAENLPPRTLARLARQVRDAFKSPPEGVRLVVDTESGLPTNLGELMAELEGPQGTPYEGKFFLLKLVFSQEFPAAPPRGFFLTKIYHPNVDMSTGAICVNTLKKDWTSETTLSHVLAVIRCLLIVPFPESSLNDEAGKLFMESYDEYSKRARLMADVHGRSASFSANLNNNEDDGDQTKKPAAVDSDRSGGGGDRGILKSSSDNPLRSNNTKVKATTGKKTKKKSLKRL